MVNQILALVRVAVAVRRLYGKGRVYLAYVSISLLIVEGSQGRSLKVGADAEATKERCVLTCILYFA